MNKSRFATAAALLAVAGAASAGTSVTATWASDYDWRGVTQNVVTDAFQLSGTYTTDFGLYAGLWGSTLAGGDIEIDEFIGFAGGDAENLVGYDVGVNYYSYSNGKLVNGGNNPNFGELYAGVSHGPFGVKLWWSPDFAGKTNTGSQSAFYLEGNAALPLPGVEGLKFLAHVGYSKGDGIEAAYGGEDKYLDWSAGFGYDVGNFNAFLKYVDGSDSDFYENVLGAPDSAGSRFVFGLSTTLPWK